MADLPDPEASAEAILEGTWRPIAGERFIPVDPIIIAHHLGIEVFDAEMEHGKSGMLIKSKEWGDPRIVLNRDDSRHRARFSCAHEIGHFVQRQGYDDGATYEYVDYRKDMSESESRQHDPIERFANRFAGALLMPRSEVEMRWAQTAGVVGLASQFDVSAAAMRYRLTQLRMLAV